MLSSRNRNQRWHPRPRAEACALASDRRWSAWRSTSCHSRPSRYNHFFASAMLEEIFDMRCIAAESRDIVLTDDPLQEQRGCGRDPGREIDEDAVLEAPALSESHALAHCRIIAGAIRGRWIEQAEEHVRRPGLLVGWLPSAELAIRPHARQVVAVLPVARGMMHASRCSSCAAIPHARRERRGKIKQARSRPHGGESSFRGCCPSPARTAVWTMIAHRSRLSGTAVSTPEVTSHIHIHKPASCKSS